MRYPNLQHCPS